MAFYVHISDFVLIGGAGNAAAPTSQGLVFLSIKVESTSLDKIIMDTLDPLSVLFISCKSLQNAIAEISEMFRKIMKSN